MATLRAGFVSAHDRDDRDPRDAGHFPVWVDSQRSLEAALQTATDRQQRSVNYLPSDLEDLLTLRVAVSLRSRSYPRRLAPSSRSPLDLATRDQRSSPVNQWTRARVRTQAVLPEEAPLLTCPPELCMSRHWRLASTRPSSVWPRLVRCSIARPIPSKRWPAGPYRSRDAIQPFGQLLVESRRTCPIE
jgi:hypothetical protein